MARNFTIAREASERLSKYPVPQPISFNLVPYVIAGAAARNAHLFDLGPHLLNHLTYIAHSKCNRFEHCACEVSPRVGFRNPKEDTTRVRIQDRRTFSDQV